MLVSIVIPTRDRLSKIRNCLDSISNLYSGPFTLEVIIVDDGSRDDTYKYLQAEKNNYKYPATILQASGCGPAAARNLGWRESSGQIVVFTDDDCLPSPFWICELVDYITNNPEYGGVGGRIVRAKDGLIPKYLDYFGALAHKGSARNASFLVSANCAYRRAVLEQCNGFCEQIPIAGGEDPELSYRLTALGVKLAHIMEAIVHHDHPTNLKAFSKMFMRYGKGDHYMLSLGYKKYSSQGSIVRLLYYICKTLVLFPSRSKLKVHETISFKFLDCLRLSVMFIGFHSV